jgi:hypothetical protein
MTIPRIYESFGFPPWRWGNSHNKEMKPCLTYRVATL